VKSVRSLLMIAAAGLALAAGIAVAQNQGGEDAPMHGSMHRGMHGHMMGGPEFQMFLHKLNLSEDQKAQVKQIFQTERPTLKPLMQQEAQAHLQMMQLVSSGNFDQAKATAIASQEAQTHIQVEVEHAKIHSQIYQLLNSEQKAKVAEMISKHQQMMQEHLQKEGAAAEQQ